MGVSGGISFSPITCDACQNSGVMKTSAAAHSGENAPPAPNTEPIPTSTIAVANTCRIDGRSPTKIVESTSEKTGSVCKSRTPATAPIPVSP